MHSFIIDATNLITIPYFYEMLLDFHILAFLEYSSAASKIHQRLINTNDFFSLIMGASHLNFLLNWKNTDKKSHNTSFMASNVPVHVAKKGNGKKIVRAMAT